MWGVPLTFALVKSCLSLLVWSLQLLHTAFHACYCLYLVLRCLFHFLSSSDVTKTQNRLTILFSSPAPPLPQRRTSPRATPSPTDGTAYGRDVSARRSSNSARNTTAIANPAYSFTSCGGGGGHGMAVTSVVKSAAKEAKTGLTCARRGSSFHTRLSRCLDAAGPVAAALY